LTTERKNYYTPVAVDTTKIPIALKNAQRQYEIALRASKGETYENIGRDFGITKQRVGDILKKLYKSNDKIKTPFSSENDIISRRVG
jgi:hypothetical protein